MIWSQPLPPMTRLTPGATFLLGLSRKILCTLLLPIAVKYVLDLLEISLSLAVLYGVVFALIPLVIAVNIIRIDISYRLDARRKGARLMPRIQGKRIGNLDILLGFIRGFQIKYPGDMHLPLIKSVKSNVFDLRFFWGSQIFTVEPDHIKALLATEFHNFEKGEEFIKAMYTVLGTGVFNSDGDMWKFHRSMTRPFFSRDRISHLDIFERYIEHAISIMTERIRSGNPVDFQDLISRFTLDTSAEFLFGYSTASMSAELPYPHYIPRNSKPHFSEEFVTAFMESQLLIARRHGRPFWQLFETFKDNTTEPMRVVNAFLDPIIARAIEKNKLAKQNGNKHNDNEIDEEETLLDHLAKSTDDQTILRDEVLNILIAGRDTTSATLTFAMYAFAMYPEVLKRLRAEVMEYVGPTRRPTMEDIREMKYLRAVINETLRLFPPVPFDVRCSINATTWPSNNPMEKPLYIPARTPITYSVLLMQRRTDLWGPDALEFDPDRFLDYRLKKYLTANPFIFLPFNAGPRICLGQQFAYNEMSYVLIRLLQNFSGVHLAPDAHHPAQRIPEDWSNGEGRTPIERLYPKSHLTMYANGGLWLTLDEATEKNE